MKKGNSLVTTRQSKIALINKVNKAEPYIKIQHLCSLLEVPIYSYYYKSSNRSVDRNIIEKKKDIAHDTLGTYGKRRMCHELNNQGVTIGLHKTRTLMKKAGIFAKMPKIRHQYEPDIETLDIPNILDRAYQQSYLNKVWRSDITYIHKASSWSYLATVFDLANREVVGHSMSQQLMFHSDQGCQYTSKKLRKFLDERQITQSMSRSGNCWDNVVQERFFRNLKFGHYRFLNAKYGFYLSRVELSLLKFNTTKNRAGAFALSYVI